MTGIDAAARRILEARARLLAQPLPEPAVSGDSLELLVFSRGGATYAVEAASVVEVVAPSEPTPVPWVPPAVLGVLNHRGRIIPVIDVGGLLESAAGEAAETALAVVVVAGEAWFGLQADSVADVQQIERRDVRPGTELGDGRRDGVISGLAAPMTAILDVEALARDPRVEVDDEVE